MSYCLKLSNCVRTFILLSPGKISLALSESRLLGFDCEWVTPQDGGGARPVAMLQLATAQGWCVLVRTCRLPGRSLPQGLVSVLEDPGVLKLGVGIQDDARKCLADLDVQVRGFVDLRHLLPHLSGGTKIRKSGLAGLAKAFLGVDLDKDWRYVGHRKSFNSRFMNI